MKIFLKTALILSVFFSSSCAFFNNRTVDLAIDSQPSGANILIDGQNYGTTPATIKIEPKSYDITLNKAGFGSQSFKTEIWWGTVRTDINGKKTSDGTRCILDMLSLIFSFNAYNAAKCGDFKQKQYYITIPQTQNRGGDYLNYQPRTPMNYNQNSLESQQRYPQ